MMKSYIKNNINYSYNNEITNCNNCLIDLNNKFESNKNQILQKINLFKTTIMIRYIK